MSLSSILDYIGTALLALAFVFLVLAALRMSSLSARRSSRRESLPKISERLQAIRRADWKCAAWLCCIALAAFALSVLGSGPFFTEPSGNTAGGAVLISGVVGLLLAIVLIIRYMNLSRALRAMDDSVED